MNVFFDVDDTIICGLDGTLRPHVRDVFARIRADGYAIYVWSAAGRRWPDVELHGLRDLVEDCYVKPVCDHERTLSAQGAVEPHFVVDDDRAIVDLFGGCHVRAYAAGDPADDEMRRAYDMLRAFAARGADAPKVSAPAVRHGIAAAG